MRFDRATKTHLLVDMNLTFDPTGSTVEVQIEGTWFPAMWQGSAVTSGSSWVQTAKTTATFAGPEADPTGATVLALGRHPTRTRVTTGADIITHASSPIYVD